MLRLAALPLLLAATASAFSPATFVGNSNRVSLSARGFSPTCASRSARVAQWSMDTEKPGPSPTPSLGGKKKGGKPKELHVVLIGLSHKTASVDVREKLAVQEPNWAAAGKALTHLPGIKEAAVLSTCNRFEIYVVTEDVHAGTRQVVEHLSGRSGVPMRELRDSLFMLSKEEAVWHSLRVASGLDSLVIGEGQILSQMKRCYEIATDDSGAAGKVLTRLLNTAVAAGKRVRSETEIARGGVSISSAAVELVDNKCVDDLDLEMDQLDICILGAGKMARLLVQHLTPRNVKSITVVNRSPGRVEELQEMFPQSNIKLALLPEMLETVAESHVSFACTGAMEPILTKENLQEHVERPVMLVDISVPRNIDDKGANELANVKAYNVDDLKAVVAANQAKRQRLVIEAEELLKEEKSSFGNWHQSLGTVPMITKLQSRAEKIRKQELKRVTNKLSGLSPAEKATVERLSKGIVAKLLHGPMSHLRTMENVKDRSSTVKSLEQMFKL